MSRILTLEDLQNYLDYMHNEVNSFSHIPGQHYVEPTLRGFVVYLATPPDERKTGAGASPRGLLSK